jgi:uncharacterized protein YcbK (DUF882 family)
MLLRSKLPLLALLGCLSAGGVAVSLGARHSPAAAAAKPSASSAAAAPSSSLATRVAEVRAPTGFATLPALRIRNQTTREQRQLRLYDAYGVVDEAAARELDALLCDARQPKQCTATRLDRRTLQLMFRAAYHFAALEVEVVSAYRKPGRRREGHHGRGVAIDFRIPGVEAAALASYLRESPRTGVGVYTHPKTQYVHLDVRQQSFHWLDASPPRRNWREKSIGSPELAKRDASYRPELDLPELPGSHTGAVKAANAQ